MCRIKTIQLKLGKNKSIICMHHKKTKDEEKISPFMLNVSEAVAPIWENSSINTLLILVCSSELSAHVCSNLCYLTCLRHLIRSRAGTNLILFLSLKAYFPSCVRNMF